MEIDPLLPIPSPRCVCPATLTACVVLSGACARRAGCLVVLQNSLHGEGEIWTPHIAVCSESPFSKKKHSRSQAQVRAEAYTRKLRDAANPPEQREGRLSLFHPNAR